MACPSYIPPPEERGIDVSPVVVTSEQSGAARVSGRLRLSTAAFDRPETLDVALRDLAQFGFGPDRLVTLSCKHKGEPSRLASAGFDCSGHDVAASDPAAARRLLGNLAPLAYAAGEIRALLTQHALVIVVLAETFSQHRKAVRILLKRADSRVFTSELSCDGPVTGTQE